MELQADPEFVPREEEMEDEDTSSDEEMGDDAGGEDATTTDGGSDGGATNGMDSGLDSTKKGRSYLKWTDEMDKAMLDVFVEYYSKGDRAQNGWKPYTAAVKKVREKCQIELTKENIISRSKTFDKHYAIVNKMLSQSGFGWDDEKNMVTVEDDVWNTYVKGGCIGEAVELFLVMLEDGFEPDGYTMSSMVSACAEFGSVRLGQQLHSLAFRLGLVSDSCVSCGLVDMYAKLHMEQSMEYSRKVFERMPRHTVVSWTALISGYLQCGAQENNVMELFCEMLNESIKPNHMTCSIVLKACANFSDQDSGRQIHAHVVKTSIADVNVVGNALVSMYAESGCMEEARQAFNKLYERNILSISSDIGGAQRSNASWSSHMESMDIGVSTFTFASLLSAAASLGLLTKGQQLHALSMKAGFGSDKGVSNSVVSMYSRCGYLEDACRAFDEMMGHNVISWTSIISGLAKHGYAERALSLFRDMILAGVKPNDVTYIAVLSACSHVGLVKEGKEHFKSMQKDHGLIPRMEHYACMVDLLARAGLVQEALEFIYEMPYKADAVVWKTLLGACKTYENIEIGGIAANHVIDLDPQDPAPYVLLSNLYSQAGLWDEVARIRSLMRDQNLSKEIGLSWIDVGNTIHEFRAARSLSLLSRECPWPPEPGEDDIIMIGRSTRDGATVLLYTVYRLRFRPRGPHKFKQNN
uniref:Uncharacterized protein n=1 Tax=Avena sativa TaxID=4498 RepID=A0ACD6AJH6_AVESA